VQLNRLKKMERSGGLGSDNTVLVVEAVRGMTAMLAEMHRDMREGRALTHEALNQLITLSTRGPAHPVPCFTATTCKAGFYFKSSGTLRCFAIPMSTGWPVFSTTRL